MINKLLRAVGMMMLVASGLALCLVIYVASIEIKKQYVAHKHIDIHGTFNFEMAEKFRKLVENKDPGDVITVHIESWGGLVMSYDKIMYYRDKTGVKMHCTVDSHAASAAAMMLMRCDKIDAAPKSLIIFHVIQVCEERGLFGCSKQRAVSPTFHPDLYARSVEMLAPARYVLTELQWKDLMNSEDVVITGEQLMTMLKEIPRNKLK